MVIPGEERDHIALLRQRAEDALRGKPVEVDDLSSQDVQYLLHELQVHQAELSLQNEELRRMHVALETARDQYTDLYNFAPAGYCTIDHKGHILNVNRTMAGILGQAPEKLLRERLQKYIIREDRDLFYLYCKQAFEKQRLLSTEVRFETHGGGRMYAHLESMVSHDEVDQLMVMVIDITQQRDLQRRIIDNREQERYQIARDLHDGPVQALSAINFTLQEMLAEFSDERLANYLKDIRARIREQVKVLRGYSMELRPPILAHLGLEKAISSHAQGFQDKHPHIKLQLDLQPTRMVLSESMGLALYRIYQEATNNITKHALAEASKVTVRLKKDDYLVQLEIHDNGQGFELPEQWLDFARDGHLGLLGMRERAEAVGGQLKIETRSGSGTHIWVMVPLNGTQASE